MSNVRFFYLRDANRNPVACIATDENVTERSVKFALSICHPSDAFDKPMARKIAQDRLTVRSNSLELCLELKNYSAVQRAVLTSLAADNTLPNRIRNESLNWLVRN